MKGFLTEGWGWGKDGRFCGKKASGYDDKKCWNCMRSADIINLQ
jgi:hypothetical protein